jgi:hypothetical protein
MVGDENQSIGVRPMQTLRHLTILLTRTATIVLPCVILGFVLAFSCAVVSANAKALSNDEIDRIVKEPANQEIIEAFLRLELGEMNEYAVKPLLAGRPSLVFFINQAQRGPLKNLIFLEDQIDRLRDAQRDINAFPYSVAFSEGEKKIVLSLKDWADEIVLIGIPRFKMDLHKILSAAKELANRKGKRPMELLPDVEFRNAVYRRCEPMPKELDEEMGRMSQGEWLCFRLGWELEKVTVARWWLTFHDNHLPKPNDYEVFRKKRSEYWSKRQAAIYGLDGGRKSDSAGRNKR